MVILDLERTCNMNKKYINNLEYPLVLKALSEFCVTDIGKELCNNLEPKNTHEIVTKLLQETSEAMNLYSKKNHCQFLNYLKLIILLSY